MTKYSPKNFKAKSARIIKLVEGATKPPLSLHPHDQAKSSSFVGVGLYLWEDSIKT